MKQSLTKFKKSAMFFISGISFVVLVWLLFYGKVKALEMISPLLKKIPGSQSELVKMTEKVLGSAIEKVKKEEVKEAVQKGSEVFEQSEYTEPVREARENAKKKIDETIQSIKELPSQEIKNIKQQICKEWLGEIATEAGKQ